MTNKLDKGEIQIPDTLEAQIKTLKEFVELVEKDTLNVPKPYYDLAKKCINKLEGQIKSIYKWNCVKKDLGKKQIDLLMKDNLLEIL